MRETELLYGSDSAIRTERIIERVEVFKPVYTPLPSVKIGVCGLTAGAGATFACIILAGTVAKMGISASVKETGAPVIEDIAGEGAKRFRSADATVKIFDFSGMEENKMICQTEERDRLWQEMDCLIVVVDPLPSKIVKGFERWKTFFARQECVYVIGKMHKEVRKKEIKGIFGIQTLYEIPFIEQEYIYAAEQKGIIVSDICFVRKQLEKPLQKILRRILPAEVLKLSGHVIQ